MFSLGEPVQLGAGGPEQGIVIGRAQYQRDENRYFVRYNNAEGCLVEQWWSESALFKVE